MEGRRDWGGALSPSMRCRYGKGPWGLHDHLSGVESRGQWSRQRLPTRVTCPMFHACGVAGQNNADGGRSWFLCVIDTGNSRSNSRSDGAKPDKEKRETGKEANTTSADPTGSSKLAIAQGWYMRVLLR